MNILNNILNEGNKILLNSINGYKEKLNEYEEKLNVLNVLNSLNNEEEKNKKLNNIINKYKSYIEYISYIKEQFNNIKEIQQIEKQKDFQYNCMYIGNGILYYCGDFLKYSHKEQFEIILNHILHYLGVLYINTNVRSEKVRLSYILAAIKICYGEELNLSKKRNIYDLYNDENHIIFDILPTYAKFIKNNLNNLNIFYKKYNDISKEEYIYTIYIQLNNSELSIIPLELSNDLKLKNADFNITKLKNEIKQYYQLENYNILYN